METPPDETCENDNKYIKLPPEDDLSENPYKTMKVWRPFPGAIFAFIISYISFLFFSDSPLPFSLPTFLFSKPEFNAEAFLNQASQLSIQLDRKVIQASSTKDQIFPMLISQNITIPDNLPRASVDLICVFDFSRLGVHHQTQTKQIRSLFRKFLPLMTDQDRVSIVLIDDVHSAKILSFVPLTYTTKQNREKIINSIGENILKGEIPITEAPINILEQRNGINQATGIFLFSDADLRFSERPFFKYQLGLQDVYTVLQISSYYLVELAHNLKWSLETLRNDVFQTELRIKPEESQLFKGVEILNQYNEQKFYFDTFDIWDAQDGIFELEDSYLKFDLKEFVFDLKIPKITQALPSSPIEVKVASCQLIFTLFNRSQVVKNFDLTVKIVGEGEEFTHEEESPEAMKNFYRKWRDRFFYIGLNDFMRNKELLRRFKESVENSFVKDDEEIQNLVKETEEKIAEYERWIFSLEASTILEQENILNALDKETKSEKD